MPKCCKRAAAVTSVLNRLIESESYGNDYNVTLMMSDLTNAIFLADANSNVSNTRQTLQLNYINRLISLAGLGESSSPIAQLRNRGYNGIVKGAHIRDGVDLKRTMITVIVAMMPVLIWGLFNVGYQH